MDGPGLRVHNPRETRAGDEVSYDFRAISALVLLLLQEQSNGHGD